MKENKVIREKTQQGINATKAKPQFFSGKGFYIALAISLVAIGGAAWIGINSIMGKLQSDNNSAIELEQVLPKAVEPDSEWSIPSEKEAAKSQAGIDANVTPSDPEVEVNTQEALPNQNQGFIPSISGEILNAYSGDMVAKSKTLDEWVMHTGVDIKAAASTPVKAVSGGTVSSVYNDDMWGACVVISHADGVESHYYSLKSAVNVKKNQQVKLGDVIGSVGTTAQIEQADESHLHFAMKQNGEWVDPAKFIKAN